MVLIALIVVSISAQVASLSVSRIRRSDNEQELLFRGQAYLQAIESYHEAVPGSPAYPGYLTDLEKDPRFLHKRHIRQLYEEPLTGAWRVLRNSSGGIIGVASSSLDKPLKTDNFPIKLNAFSGMERYSDWEFIYSPQSATIEPKI